MTLTEPAAVRNPDSIQDDVVERLPELAMLSRPPHPHGLLIGPCPVIVAAVTRLLPHLRRPIAARSAWLDAGLPGMTRGTLLLWNLDRLDRPRQRDLLDWMDSRRDVQVVSVASRDPFDLVEHGEFLDALYYRLNVVRVDMPGTGRTEAGLRGEYEP